MSNPHFSFDDIDRYQQIEMMFNIFPNNMTFLHKISEALTTPLGRGAK